MSRSRGWCFTLNNYTEDQLQTLKTLIPQECSWGIIGKEIGESGTPHLQGAVWFRNPVSMRTAKRKLECQMHLEQCRGSPAENKAYCSKQDPEPWEHGNMPEQGRRCDLETLADLYKQGTPLKELWDKCTTPQHFKMIENLMLRIPRRTNTAKEVTWICGPSGSGKTRMAFELASEVTEGDEDEIWISHEDGKWKEGYIGQKVAILDDLSKNTFEFKSLLRMLDRYKLTVAVKGTHALWVPSHVFITALSRPERMFRRYKQDKLVQLMRRITRVIELEMPLDP